MGRRGARALFTDNPLQRWRRWPQPHQEEEKEEEEEEEEEEGEANNYHTLSSLIGIEGN